MGEMKPTPGPWVIHPTALHPAVRSVGTEEIGPRRICTVGSMNGNPVDKANARLIAEAGTVFHNTGLSPVQLVEQRDELMAACRKMVEWEKCEKDYSIGFTERINLCAEAFEMMRAALAKCEGKV